MVPTISQRIGGTSLPRGATLVLTIPSVERDGAGRIDQRSWVQAAVQLLAGLFGAAIAEPPMTRARRDLGRGRWLVWDEPVLVRCHASPEDLARPESLRALAEFCHRMLRETRQDEIELRVGDERIAIRSSDPPGAEPAS